MHDGPPSLDLIQRETYDVELLERLMPDMDGLTLYQGLKELYADTAKVRASAHAGGGSAEHGFVT